MKAASLSRLALLSLCAAGLCVTAASVSAQSADTLRIRLNADIRSTDPGMNRDANTDAVIQHVVEGLVAYKEDATVGPLLAESIDVSPDGKTYTFRLREPLRFHNGQPLTSADVVRTWQRYMDPANNWRCLSEFDGRGATKVLDVQAPDARTVVYTLEQPSVLFLGILARPDCGGTGIYHADSLDAQGRWVAPIGSGPYRWVDWKRGEHIDLARFDGYAARSGTRDGYTGNKTALIDKVRFMVIPDPSSARIALQTGAVDVLSEVEEQDMAEYRRYPGITLDTKMTMDMQGLLLQTQDPLLKDVRLRQALALALDVPSLVEAVTNGMAQPNRSIIPSPSRFHQAAQQAVAPRDLAAARKLLNEAGYRGQPIKLLTSKRYQYLFDTAMLVQAMAAEAGIRMDVEVLEWATMLDRYNKGDYQAMAFTYSPRMDPALSYEMISGPKAQQPRKVWDDPQVAQWLAASMQESDPAQRQAIFDQLDAKLRADVPAVFFYSKARTAATGPQVSGYAGWPTGMPRAWGVTLQR